MLETLLIRSRAIPSEPPRRRGATTLGPEKDRFGVLKQVLAAVPWLQAGMGIAILLAAGLVPWATGKVLGAMDQQILAIDVNGEFVGDSRVAFERQAGNWIGKSYFSTDLSDIKNDLEKRPWIESVAVRRVWPDRLEIIIREKTPLAYWTDGRLVSRTGELFMPPKPDVAGRLPQLAGPDERVRDVISMARTMSDKLVAHGLGFSGLELEQRGAWTLRLSNGIEVEIGRASCRERV